MTTALAEIVDTAALRVVPEDVLRDRYRGALVGAAVGNALGLDVEGRSRDHIAGRYPGGIRDIDPRQRDLPWDDDVAQMILLAEAIVERGGLDDDDLRQRFVRWYRESGRGIGLLTAEVVAEMERGNRDAAREVWERGGRQAAGNGAVMRCAPIALAHRTSGRDLVAQARASARITHHDPRCQWSTAAVDVALAATLSGSPVDIRALAEALEASGAPRDVAEHVRAVEGAELRSFSLDDWAMGYTLKAMQVGLWCLTEDREPEETLVTVVAAGGDTDTNAAVAGAALGAREGASAWPSRWLSALPDQGHLTLLADRLLEGSWQL